MARFLFTWELGAHLGHLSRFKVLADTLHQQGHEIAIVSRELYSLQSLFGTQAPYRFYQAPLSRQGAKSSRPPLTYSEILLCNGYHDANELLFLVNAWRSIISAEKPDCIVYDFSPTAILASRELTIPKVDIGTGFFIHPLTSPSPSLVSHQPLAEPQRKLTDNAVTKVINQVLLNTHQTTLHTFSNFFDGVTPWLITYPELDTLNSERKFDTPYQGILSTHQGGQKPDWQTTQKPKIFAYLKAQCPLLDSILSALTSLNAESIIYLSGATEDHLNEYQNNNIAISTQPYDMEPITKDCDLIICHAGHDTVCNSLLAGIPLFLLPHYREQLNIAESVVKIKAGLLQRTVKPLESQVIASQIQALLSERLFKKSAEAFADKYRSLSPAKATQNLINYCLQAIVDT